MTLAWGLLIPFLGTSLGAFLVFFIKDKLNPRLEKVLIGFASGVMIAASFFSLLEPSIEMSKDSKLPSYLPAAIGFMLGMFFLLLLDSLIPHLHKDATKPEGLSSHLKKKTMMVFAITLHNIPEGMAVGVIFAGALNGEVSMSSALALSIGIAIQNFPEGAIVSMPLATIGSSKPRACLDGILSGIVEPIFALLTILLAKIMVPILPYLLAFAAGAMIYVVVEELIPESQQGEHSNLALIGVALGFVIMMVLDIALS